MSRELISSRLSYQMLKFGMPATLIGVGALVAGILLASGLGAPVIIQDDGFGVRILLVIVAPLAVVAFTAWVWDLKYVELDGNRLLVSGVRRRIVVPLNEVVAIHQNFLEPGRPIYIQLRTPGPFGESFAFVPSVYAGYVSGEPYPLVERLREMAGIHVGDDPDGAAA